MATISQLVRKPRKRKVDKNMVPALQGCPQKEASAPAFIRHTKEAQFGFEEGLSGQTN